MLGELISAGSSLLGGLFGKKSTDKANERNVALQKEFAQKGIQWKVADAKAAGIHPLAALGASTVSFSPSIVGDTSLGSSISGLGQDIGRAVNATATKDTRQTNLATQLAEETLKGARLDNEGKALQNAALASREIRHAAVGPSFPTADGSTNTGLPGQNSTKLKVAGLPFPVDPSTSRPSAFQTEFGEVGEDLAGAIRLEQSTRMLSPNQNWALLNALLGPPIGFNWKKPSWYNPAKPGNYGKPYRGNDVFQ